MFDLGLCGHGHGWSRVYPNWPPQSSATADTYSAVHGTCVMLLAGKQMSLNPGQIHFGAVPLGSVVHRTAHVVNLSTGPARFSVIKPPLPLR